MRKFIVLALLPLLFTGSALAVPQTAVVPTSGAAISGNTFTWGYVFSISQDAAITSLGVWDRNGDGLPQAQNIAIWNSGGSIVLQGVVASGTADPLIDGFRFTSTLTGSTFFLPGTYTIGTQRIGSGSIEALAGATVSIVPGVSVLSSYVNNGSALTFSQPTIPIVQTMIGPSFQIDFAVTAPELSLAGGPGALAVLACFLAMYEARKRLAGVKPDVHR